MAMLAVVRLIVGELVPNGFNGAVIGRVIIGFILAVEGFNIVKGWQTAEENGTSPDYDTHFSTERYNFSFETASFKHNLIRSLKKVSLGSKRLV